MSLPAFKKCCWCLSLETGCLILAIASTAACIANISVGAANLPRQKERKPEDNIISMNMVMFSALSAISNIIAIAGIWLRRGGWLQLSLFMNSVFVLCLFLVAVVTCLFSYELRPALQAPANVALVVLAIVAGAMYTLYYLAIVNSLYRKMKNDYDVSAIPI